MTKRAASGSPPHRNVLPRMGSPDVATADTPPDPEAEREMADPLKDASSKAQWLLQNARIDRLVLFLAQSGTVTLAITTDQEAANLALLTRQLTHEQAGTIRINITTSIHPQSGATTDKLADTIQKHPGMFRTFFLELAGSPTQATQSNSAFIAALRQQGQLLSDLCIGLTLERMSQEDAKELDALCSQLPRCAEVRIVATDHPASCWSQLGQIEDADRVGSLSISIQVTDGASVDSMLPMLRSFKGIDQLEVNVQAPNMLLPTAWADTLNGLAQLSCVRLRGAVCAGSLGQLLGDGGLPKVSHLALCTYGNVDAATVSAFTAQLAAVAPRLSELVVVFPVDVSKFFEAIQHNVSLQSLALAPAASTPDLRGAYDCFKANRYITSFKHMEYAGGVLAPLRWLSLDETAPFMNVANRNRLQFQPDGFALGAWQGFARLGPFDQDVLGYVPDDVAQKIMDFAGHEGVVQLSSAAHGIRDAAMVQGIHKADDGGENVLAYVLGTRLAWRGGRDDPTLGTLLEADLAIGLDDAKRKRYARALPALLDSLANRLVADDGQASPARKLLDDLVTRRTINPSQAVEAMHASGFSPSDQASWLVEGLYDESVPEGLSPELQDWFRGLVYVLHTLRPWPHKLVRLTDHVHAAISAVRDVLDVVSHSAESALGALGVLSKHIDQPEVLARFAAGAIKRWDLSAEAAAELLKARKIGPEAFFAFTEADNANLSEGATLMRLMGHPGGDCAKMLAQGVGSPDRPKSTKFSVELRKLFPSNEAALAVLCDHESLERSDIGQSELAEIVAMTYRYGVIADEGLDQIAATITSRTERATFLLSVIKNMKPV